MPHPNNSVSYAMMTLPLLDPNHQVPTMKWIITTKELGQSMGVVINTLMKGPLIIEISESSILFTADRGDTQVSKSLIIGPNMIYKPSLEITALRSCLKAIKDSATSVFVMSQMQHSSMPSKIISKKNIQVMVQYNKDHMLIQGNVRYHVSGKLFKGGSFGVDIPTPILKTIFNYIGDNTYVIEVAHILHEDGLFIIHYLKPRCEVLEEESDPDYKELNAIPYICFHKKSSLTYYDYERAV